LTTDKIYIIPPQKGNKMNNDYEIRGDTTAIFLRRKDGTMLEALIDTEDFDKVNAYAGRWVPQWNSSVRSFYVVKVKSRRRGMSDPRVRLRLHRIITDCPDSMEVDHLNHNALDNRKCNLKVCTHSENMKNMKNFIGYQTKGTVYWHKAKRYWVSQIVIEGKTIFQKYSKEKSIVEEALKNKLLDLKYPLDDLQKVC
jgi:hypothetical protein